MSIPRFSACLRVECIALPIAEQQETALQFPGGRFWFECQHRVRRGYAVDPKQADSRQRKKRAFLQVRRPPLSSQSSPTPENACVVNACLDRIRRNKSRAAFSLSSENAEEPRDHRDYAAGVDMSLTVEQALASLPPEQRAAVVAVDVEGYPVAEAAERLGVPVGTVKSRCARARKRLAAQLEDFREGGNHS